MTDRPNPTAEQLRARSAGFTVGELRSWLANYPASTPLTFKGGLLTFHTIQNGHAGAIDVQFNEVIHNRTISYPEFD